MSGPPAPLVPRFAVPLALLGIAAAAACQQASMPGPEPGTTRTVGSEACADCHYDQYDIWDYGGHRVVACETCHGPGADHVEASEPMGLCGGTDLCLSCHGQARPDASAPPQVGSLDEHVSFVSDKHKQTIDRAKIQGRCDYCHDPHSLE